MIDLLAKIFKALNSDSNPWQIAFAVGLGFIMGMSPFWSPHNLIVLLAAFIFRIHLATFWIAVAGFSGIAYMVDPYADNLGYQILTHSDLQQTWTALYQSDFWRFTKFNHTVTLGMLVISIVAFIPVVVFFRILVSQYRAHILTWFNRLKIMQLLKASKVYEKYQSLP